jgi:hypothetical protein
VIQDLSGLDPEIAAQVYRPGEDGMVEEFTWTSDKADRPRQVEVFGSDEESEIDVEIP